MKEFINNELDLNDKFQSKKNFILIRSFKALINHQGQERKPLSTFGKAKSISESKANQDLIKSFARLCRLKRSALAAYRRLSLPSHRKSSKNIIRTLKLPVFERF